MKKITLLILTLCVSFMSYAQFPESFDGGATIPAGWAVFDNGVGTTWSWTVNDTDDYVSVRWSEVLPAGQLAEDWIVTPQVAITTANNLLTFDMGDFNAPDYGSEVTIRISTDPTQTNIAGFTATELTIDELDTNGGGLTSSWAVDLDAYVGMSIYVAWVMENNDGDAWGLDNVDFVPLPACLDPTVAFDDFTTTTADISMNAVANYDVEWGVFPYTQGSGGSTATVTGADTYQLTGLMPGVSYNVFVRQDCGGANGTSAYVETVVGTSPDLSTLPLTEDLEPAADQALLLNFGLSFANLTGNWSFGADDLTDGDTTNDFSNSPVSYLFSNSTFTDAAADATFYIGPFDLTTANEYTFMFMQRNIVVSDPTTPAKDIEIVVATVNDGSANTVLQTLDGLDNITHTQRMASFIPSADGSYYFGVRDKTALLTGVTAANVVIIDDISITSQLSVEDFESNSFTHRYIKNTETLNLESSNMSMTNVEIYSILGQNVISKPLSSASESINVSDLNDGVYLAKVFIGGNSKTIKFVKN